MPDPEPTTIDPDAAYMVEQLQQQRNDWVTRANQYARERDDAREELAQAPNRILDPLPITWTVPVTTPGRPLDPVRAAALQAAVNLHRHDKHATPLEVLKVAEEFERYLTGTDT